LKVTYKPDFRNAIAAGWPRALDDTEARNDWGWKHRFGLSEIVKGM
jgi:nucleoside-diphosphate-sugar epimerase